MWVKPDKQIRVVLTEFSGLSVSELVISFFHLVGWNGSIDVKDFVTPLNRDVLLLAVILNIMSYINPCVPFTANSVLALPILDE